MPMFFCFSFERMDQADLYDQFGNYMGPELESDEEEDDDQQIGYRQELGNVDQTSDMVRISSLQKI